MKYLMKLLTDVLFPPVEEVFAVVGTSHSIRFGLKLARFERWSD